MDGLDDAVTEEVPAFKPMDLFPASYCESSQVWLPP